MKIVEDWNVGVVPSLLVAFPSPVFFGTIVHNVDLVPKAGQDKKVGVCQNVGVGQNDDGGRDVEDVQGRQQLQVKVLEIRLEFKVPA